MRPQLKTGCKAYYDSASGALACKVLAVEVTPTGRHVATIQFTHRNQRAPYATGLIERFPVRCVFPREALYQRRGRYFIGSYDVEFDCGSEPKVQNIETTPYFNFNDDGQRVPALGGKSCT